MKFTGILIAAALASTSAHAGTFDADSRDGGSVLIPHCYVDISQWDHFDEFDIIVNVADKARERSKFEVGARKFDNKHDRDRNVTFHVERPAQYNVGNISLSSDKTTVTWEGDSKNTHEDDQARMLGKLELVYWNDDGKKLPFWHYTETVMGPGMDAPVLINSCWAKAIGVDEVQEGLTVDPEDEDAKKAREFFERKQAKETEDRRDQERRVKELLDQRVTDLLGGPVENLTCPEARELARRARIVLRYSTACGGSDQTLLESLACTSQQSDLEVASEALSKKIERDCEKK